MSRAVQGVTLIELLVAMAVLAVLLGIAAPSFANLVRDARVATASNGMLMMLHYTRSEAIKRGHRVTACVSSDQLRCTPGAHWHRGWIVFADGNGNGTREADEALLRSEPPRSDGVSIRGDLKLGNYVSYVASGRSTHANSASPQMGSLSICAAGAGRRVAVSATGRARVEALAC